MKRSLLFIGYDPPMENEIREYMQDQDTETLFAHTHEQAIHILDARAVQRVVLNLRSMGDAGIIRYITQYFPEVKLVVSAAQEYDELITIFSQSNYTRLPRPFRLEELKTMI